MFNGLDLLDITVVYLALGAPLGVYHLVTHWSDSLAATFSLAIANVFLWPVAAFVFLYRKARDPRSGVIRASETKTAAIESAAESVLSTEELFVFRETVSRYAAISTALGQPIGTSWIDGLFDIGDTPAGAPTRACIGRRNLAKLCLHQMDARQQVLAQVNLAASRDPSILAIANSMFLELQDPVAADALASMKLPGASRSRIGSDNISMAA